MEVIHWKDYFREKEQICVNLSVYIEGEHHEHTHDFLEITYVAQGSGIHWFEGKRIEVRKGDLFFINYSCSHHFEPISSDFRWMNCIFLPEAVDPSLVHSGNAEDILKYMLFRYLFPEKIPNINELQLSGEVDEFGGLFNEMLREYDQAKSGYQGILKYYLYILLTRIFRAYSSKKSNPEEQIDNGMIYQVLRYLQDNSHKTIKLEDIARQAFLSPTYFSTLFKQKTGESVTDYIHHLRITKACNLLLQTTWSVNAVMHEVGYQDSKFFYEVFKRHTGDTPGKYRKTKTV